MKPPEPSPQLLAQQIRFARSRGLPVQDAEDLVFEAWQHAVQRFDARRGAFPAFLTHVVKQRCAMWWRQQGVSARAREHQSHLRLVPDVPEDPERANQLLASLSADERRIFNAWARQKQLGKGRVRSAEVAESLGMTPEAYENAKRRLRARLHRLLADFGWDAVYSGGG